jgi:hypothetical protein
VQLVAFNEGSRNWPGRHSEEEDEEAIHQINVFSLAHKEGERRSLKQSETQVFQSTYLNPMTGQNISRFQQVAPIYENQLILLKTSSNGKKQKKQKLKKPKEL